MTSTTLACPQCGGQVDYSLKLCPGCGTTSMSALENITDATQLINLMRSLDSSVREAYDMPACPQPELTPASLLLIGTSAAQVALALYFAQLGSAPCAALALMTAGTAYWLGRKASIEPSLQLDRARIHEINEKRLYVDNRLQAMGFPAIGFGDEV